MPGEIDPADRFYEDLGRRVRRARDARGMTQQTLAAHVGLTRSSVANLEAGRQRVPVHLFVKMAAALDVDPVELLPHFDLDDEGEWAVVHDGLAGSPESTRIFVLGALARAKPGGR